MRPIHGKQIWELLCHNRLLVMLLLAVIVTSFTLTGTIFKQQHKSKQVVEDFEENYGGKAYYWVNEALDDFSYNAYMRADENGFLYEKMHALVTSMWEESSFDYYTCNAQDIYIKGKMEDVFLSNYEAGTSEYDISEIDGVTLSATKALLVSDKFFTCNNVEIKTGRGFQEEDYFYKETVPVILGNEYKNYYQLGDTFEADYFGDKKLEVVGFLDNQTFYLSSASNEFVSLERFMLLPAWNLEERNDFSKYVTLLELSGNIQSTIGDSETKAEVERLFQMQNSAWDFNLRNPESNGQVSVVTKYSTMTKQVEKQFNVMVVLVVSFTLISLLLNAFSVLEKNKYTFGVELLCGAGFCDIYIEGLGFVLAIVFCGDLLATLLLLVMASGTASIVLVQILTCAISVIMAIGCFIYIKKMKIGEIIGGKE